MAFSHPYNTTNYSLFLPLKQLIFVLLTMYRKVLFIFGFEKKKGQKIWTCDVTSFWIAEQEHIVTACPV